jgi:thioredoxin 1
MGTATNLSADQFDTEVLRSDIPVLVDFWATWCVPCKRIAPFVDEVSAELAGKAKVVKVDVDTAGDVSMRYNVMSIPTLIVFKGGQEVDRMTGAGSKDQIAGLINRHL